MEIAALVDAVVGDDGAARARDRQPGRGARPAAGQGLRRDAARLRRARARRARRRTAAGGLRLLGSGASRPRRSRSCGSTGRRRTRRCPKGGTRDPGPGSRGPPTRGSEPRAPSPEPRPASAGGRAAMIVNQWVPAAHRGDAIGDSARRVRGLLRAMGHQSDLFALTIDDDLRGDVRPFADPARAARRPDHLPLRPAVADDRGVRPAAARARAAVPQRDAGPFLRALRRRHLPARRARPRGAGDAGRAHRRRAGRLGLQPRRSSTALGFDQHRRLPDRRRRRADHRGAAAPGARAGARRRPAELPVRRPDRARTRRSRITSGWPRSTSATSTSTTASSSSARPTACRATTTWCGRSSPSTRCRPIGSSSPGRCPTRTWRPTTAPPASTSRCRSTRASACRCSRRWPPTCRCWPTAPRPCPTRWAAPACSSRPRISSSPPSCSARWPTTRRCAARVIAGQRRRLRRLRRRPHPQALEAVVAGAVPHSPAPAGRHGARS